MNVVDFFVFALRLVDFRYYVGEVEQKKQI